MCQVGSPSESGHVSIWRLRRSLISITTLLKAVGNGDVWQTSTPWRKTDPTPYVDVIKAGPLLTLPLVFKD
jgi:hypothetical protein